MFASPKEDDGCLRCGNATGIMEGVFAREEKATYAEMAPPPLAWPSILVTIIAPKSALSLKARL
jgi:hypothetical protein